MFEGIFPDLNSFFPQLDSIFPGLDFFGIPFLFWVIAIIVVVVLIFLVFVVFRPRAPKAASQTPDQNYSLNSKDISADPFSNEPPPLPKTDSPQTSVSQTSSTNAQTAPSPNTTVSTSSVSTPSSVIKETPAASQKDLNVIKTDNSLKQLLITKFQSKIEGQLGDKVTISDVSAEGVNFLITIEIAGVGMILTLDPAGKIIDYKKINPQAK